MHWKENGHKTRKDFWHQWHKEYLLSLRETLSLRHKWVRSAIDSVTQEGDIVLIN